MSISQRDQAVIWHPLTQHFNQSLLKTLVKGEGAYLFDEEGRRYLDLISSWWVNLHGHCTPEIADAIYTQARKLEHVIFAGFTHEPAVKVAEKVLSLLPDGFRKVFYSDNGSTAVEVALKMAYQYWRNQGDHQRKRFIAFENAYHGDTVGSMSLGNASHYFVHFDDLLFPVDFFPYPETWLGDEAIISKEKKILTQLEHYLEKHAHEVAALIIEPLIQGANGMSMCRPVFLQDLKELLQHYGILIIYDEVMTGFGRTGEYFACLKAGTVPDIICLAKGLTGGFLPLAITVCGDNIFNAFLSENFNKAFAHSHSYTANPLGCAAAIASLDLLTQADTLKKIKMIENVHREELKKMMCLDSIVKLRHCGTISAFDLAATVDYGSNVSIEWRKRFMDQGLLVRPIGKSIYFMPPYCIPESDLRRAYHVIVEQLQGVDYATV